MPPELTSKLLADAAPHATRVLALERIHEVSHAYDAFAAGDESGLHDLRVALRRLRSWMRAYRSEVDDTFRKKTWRELKQLARATNAARDAEVALEWIGAQSGFSPRERPGVRYIVERLDDERETAAARAKGRLERGLPRLVRALSTELETFWVQQPVTGAPATRRMSEVTHDVLLEQGEAVARSLARIDSPDDFEGIHRARIAAKRLRYLLETMNGDAAAAALVKRLTTLQDLLGQSHDAHRLRSRLVREVGECAARDARLGALRAMELGEETPPAPAFAKVRPGLVALAKRAHDADRVAFDSFRRTWRKRQVAHARVAVELVADTLAAAARADGDGG